MLCRLLKTYVNRDMNRKEMNWRVAKTLEEVELIIKQVDLKG